MWAVRSGAVQQHGADILPRRAGGVGDGIEGTAGDLEQPVVTTVPGVGVAAAGPVPAASAVPELMGVADVAKMLGVSEADALAALEKGDIKGKKIGSTWRITRAAVDEFLRS